MNEQPDLLVRRSRDAGMVAVAAGGPDDVGDAIGSRLEPPDEAYDAYVVARGGQGHARRLVVAPSSHCAGFVPRSKPTRRRRTRKGPNGRKLQLVTCVSTPARSRRAPTCAHSCLRTHCVRSRRARSRPLPACSSGPLRVRPAPGVLVRPAPGVLVPAPGCSPHPGVVARTCAHAVPGEPQVRPLLARSRARTHSWPAHAGPRAHIRPAADRLAPAAARRARRPRQHG